MSTSQPFSREVEALDVDCSGLLCPLPVYKTALALNQMEPGQRLHLTTTDPGALADIPAMTRQRGDNLISTSQHQDHQVFIIEKGSGT